MSCCYLCSAEELLSKAQIFCDLFQQRMLRTILTRMEMLRLQNLQPAHMVHERGANAVELLFCNKRFANPCADDQVLVMRYTTVKAV